MNQGIIVVAAAGNHNENNDDVNQAQYPASYGLSNIVSVAATNQNDELWKDSAYGVKTVHIAAPGENIMSTAYDVKSQADNHYVSSNGTSLAAAHVSGALALMMSACRGLTHEEYIDILLTSADQVPSLMSKIMNGNRLNLEKAVVAVINKRNEMNAVGEQPQMKRTIEEVDISEDDDDNTSTTGPTRKRRNTRK